MLNSSHDSLNKKLNCRTMENQGAGRPLEMGAENELQLADYLFACARCKYSLGYRDILELAGEFIREEKIKTRWINGTPGQDWLKNFLKRHPRVVTHKDEVWSSKQANHLHVCEFYRDLDLLYKEERVTHNDAHRLYSLLEISLSCEEQSQSLDALQHDDKLKASVLTCICADGGRLPPLVVFQGDCVSCARNRNGAPSKCSDEDILLCYWFENVFIPMLPKSEKSTILFLEGQSFRINLRVLKLAKRNNVIFLKFPPKLTNILQPLDSKYSFDLKSVYNIQFQKVTKRYRKFDDNQREKFGNVVGSIWEKSVNMNTIVRGFERTGIFPLDKSKFDENQFLEPSLKKFKETEEIETSRNISGKNYVLNPVLSENANSDCVQVPKITHVTSVVTVGQNDKDNFTAASKVGNSSTYPSFEKSETVMSKEIFQNQEKVLFSEKLQTNGKVLVDEQIQYVGKDTTQEDDDKHARYDGDDKILSHEDDKDAKYEDNSKNLSYEDTGHQEDKDTSHEGDDKDARHEVDDKDSRNEEDDKLARGQVDEKDARDQADEEDAIDQDDDRDVRHEGSEKEARHVDGDKDARHLSDAVKDVPKTAVITNRRRSERIFKRDFSGKVKISLTRKTI